MSAPTQNTMKLFCLELFMSGDEHYTFIIIIIINIKYNKGTELIKQ